MVIPPKLDLEMVQRTFIKLAADVEAQIPLEELITTMPRRLPTGGESCSSPWTNAAITPVQATGSVVLKFCEFRAITSGSKSLRVESTWPILMSFILLDRFARSANLKTSSRRRAHPASHA
jgi:hypothetical protein